MRSDRNNSSLVAIAFATLLLLFANSGVSQDPDVSPPVSERQTDPNYNPLGSKDPRYSDGPDAPKTMYDKSGKHETSDSNPYNEPQRRGRITFGKKAEVAVTKDSDRPIRIEKTKDGSSDTTQSTGVFKKSLLDIGVEPLPSPPAVKPSVSAQPSPSPIAKDIAQPKLDLAITASPSPSAHVNPETSPKPGATASPSP